MNSTSIAHNSIRISKIAENYSAVFISNAGKNFISLGNSGNLKNLLEQAARDYCNDRREDIKGEINELIEIAKLASWDFSKTREATLRAALEALSSNNDKSIDAAFSS